jgi:hypothetical protein
MSDRGFIADPRKGWWQPLSESRSKADQLDELFDAIKTIIPENNAKQRPQGTPWRLNFNGKRSIDETCFSRSSSVYDTRIRVEIR